MALPQKIGRYEIVEEVGRGAMGAVYKARDPNIGRIVAIKTILSSALSGPLADEYRKRFQREARAAGMLAHPGIVTVYDVDEQDGMAFLVMEFVTGRTLASALDIGERFPFSSIYDLGSQLAKALHYAHSHGVVHRDIKPANILLTAPPGGKPDTMVKITDFGVAKLTTSQITTVQQMLGTPAFMSPEQCTGTPVDGRSDLFSLGVILYWMSTGDKPFVGETLTALSYKIVHAEPIPPRSLNPGMPSRLEKIILRCLAKSSEARYPNGQELAADLMALAEPGTLLRLPAEEEPHVRPDDETTPMLGQPPRAIPLRPEPVEGKRRTVPPAPQPSAPPPAFSEAETSPLHPSPPPPRPAAKNAEALHAGTVAQPPAAASPPSTSSRPWYEAMSATRMGTAGRGATQESLLRAPSEPLPRQVSPASRNYMPILLGVIGLLTIVLLAVGFWPRQNTAPTPAQPATTAPSSPSVQQLASSQPASGDSSDSQPAASAAEPQITASAPASSAARPSTPTAPLPQPAASPRPAGSVANPDPGAQPALPPVAPSSTPASRIYVPGEVQRARLISSPKPAYPPLALQSRVQGNVRMQAVIAKDGTVANLEAASGHLLLIPAALDAVRQWRYRPTLVNGEPVEVATTIDLAFTLTEAANPAPASSASSVAAPAKAPAGPANPPSTAATPPAPSTTPPAKTVPAANAPPKSVPGGPPSLYSEESKATLRILAPGIPRNLELLVFMGDEQILRMLGVAGAGTRDISRDVRVLPGQRTFRVVLRTPGSPGTTPEASRTTRGRLDSRGSHTLEVEIRGTADNGLPRFNLKLK